MFSLNPEKQNKPSTDMLLRIEFTMRLSKCEIDTLLKAASYKELYTKNPRNAAIMVVSEKKIYFREDQ